MTGEAEYSFLYTIDTKPRIHTSLPDGTCTLRLEIPAEVGRRAKLPAQGYAKVQRNASGLHGSAGTRTAKVHRAEHAALHCAARTVAADLGNGTFGRAAACPGHLCQAAPSRLAS